MKECQAPNAPSTQPVRVDFVRQPMPGDAAASVPANAPVRRPAYVAELLALAHTLRPLLDRGVVYSHSELALRLNISQPRVSQIIALTYLAPAVQEAVLALEAIDGIEPMNERPLRLVLRNIGWIAQHQRWLQLLPLLHDEALARAEGGRRVRRPGKRKRRDAKATR